ncbi:hypothetical protein L9F63_011093, partial [Diploptera punctata]
PSGLPKDRNPCESDSDCVDTEACYKSFCLDPCEFTNACATTAKCHAKAHRPVCTCPTGYEGNPALSPLPICHYNEDCPPHKLCDRLNRVCINPCQEDSCGLNAQCFAVNHGIDCKCLDGYSGNPFVECAHVTGCRSDDECPSSTACINGHCQSPCKCGLNAICEVLHHKATCKCLPVCSCPTGLVGNPFEHCSTPPPADPCSPSPCGPNSVCRVRGGNAVCSCQPNYVGAPPSCRPECVTSSECPQNQACISQKCQDPCPGTCGVDARCQVVNHNPICSCPPEYTGDPFVLCTKERCRPECVLSSDCAKDRACINNKCSDPCPGTCGLNAQCRVINHVPSCSCLPGFTGDSLRSCTLIPAAPVQPICPVNPCLPSPCGPNSICRIVNNHAVCSCQPGCLGSPPTCRPECMVSSDCSQNRACINQKCQDPCPGTCGFNALCQVVNHNPVCSCAPGFTGDPFTRCLPGYTGNSIVSSVISQEERPVNPCAPSPCGPYSICRVRSGHAVCSCQAGYIGSPPTCRPECIVSTECPQDKACINQKCVDPCPGTCGLNAQCQVVNHNPICSCRQGFTGDPFVRCIQEQMVPSRPVETPRDPCNPSPCGANAVCKERNGAGSCTCLPEYTGDPYTGCRPECVLNTDCNRQRACVRNKCVDPCPGTCGVNAECRVVNHAPSCSCLPGYTGNPLNSCHLLQTTSPIEQPQKNPCKPSPCGPFSNCRVINGHAVCSCQANYIGTPPSCRPECVVSTECPQDRACVNQKCVDPCPGTCGLDARCQVVNHNPICSCMPGFTGDPFVRCLKEEPRPAPVPSGNPCVPSPCGPNSQCRPIGNTPACSCLANYVGRAPNCRPECTINEECPSNLACQNERCRDPCPGSCGVQATCVVVKHAPVCTCQPGFTGDPFAGCSAIPSLFTYEDSNKNP